MPLCGSSFCGCALTSVPADFAEIDGAYPTINVAGNGTGASPWNLTLDDEWAGEVAEFVNAGAARGVVAYAELLVPSTGYTNTPTNITSLSVTFTAVAGRRYRVLHQALWFASVAGSKVSVSLYNTTAAVNLQESVSAALLGAGSGNDTATSLMWSGSLPAGSVTLNMRAARVTSSGTVSLTAAATVPAFILVEDIGPI